MPTAQWITTGYLLAIVAVIPTAGWAANTLGARRVYLVALPGCRHTRAHCCYSLRSTTAASWS